MNDSKRKFTCLSALAVLVIAVFSAGAAAISSARTMKREISREIAACEMQINNLRRTNDELNVKIAEQVNPMRLMKRASSRLVQPNMSENIVWAYENFEGGRVVRSYKKADDTLSFKMPKKK